MPKVTGVARGATKGYAVWHEARCEWLTNAAGTPEWSMDKFKAHWFRSIDEALKRVRTGDIDMGAIQVLPVRQR